MPSPDRILRPWVLAAGLAGCALSHPAPGPDRGAAVCAEAVAASPFGWVALAADGEAALQAIEADGVVRRRHAFFADDPGAGEPLPPRVVAGSSGEVLAVWSRRPALDCRGGCRVEVAVFGPRGQTAWRSPTPTDAPEEVRAVLPDGRLLVDAGRGTASRLVDPFDGTAQRLDATVLWMGADADPDGWHPAVVLGEAGGRMALVRPADGAAREVPDHDRIGAVWGGRWVFSVPAGGPATSLAATDGVAPDGGVRLRAWVDLAGVVDAGDPTVVVDGDRALLLRGAGGQVGVPLAVVDLRARAATPLDAEPPATGDGRTPLTRVRDGFALTSVGGAPVVRVDLGAATAERLDLEALAGAGARPLARGEVAEPARLLPAGRIALGLRTEDDAGWFVQPARDRPLARVGRPMHRVDAVVGRAAGDTWWIEQIDGDPSAWPDEAPADAVVGDAVQLLRGDRSWTLAPRPDVRAAVSRSGLCALVLEGGGFGAPATRTSLLDLTTGETAELQADAADLAPLAF